MKVRSSSRLSAGIRVFIPFSMCLVLTSPFGLTGVSYAADRVLEDRVFEQWKKFEQFCYNLQGKCRLSEQKNPPDGPIKMIYTSEVRRNRNCAMVLTHREGSSQDSINIRNSKYRVRLQRPTSDPSAVVAEGLKGPLADTRDLLRSPMAHFMYWDEWLSDLLGTPAFQVKKIVEETLEGRQCLRLDFKFTEESKVRSQRFERDGSLYFDPARFWSIVTIQEQERILRDGKTYRTGEWETRYQVADHPSGYPLVKKVTQTWRLLYAEAGRKSEGKKIREWEWEVKEIPDEAFTLSAFGLPEPMGVEWPKPFPWFIVIIAGSVAAIIVAFFLFKLYQRRIGRQLAGTATSADSSS